MLNTSNYNLEWFGRKAGIALCCTFHPIKNQVRCALMCLIMNIFVCVHEYSCTFLWYFWELRPCNNLLIPMLYFRFMVYKTRKCERRKVLVPFKLKTICENQELKQSEPKSNPQNQNSKILILQIVKIQTEHMVNRASSYLPKCGHTATETVLK